MTADSRARKAAKGAQTADKLCLWLKNEAGRRGVPVLRSFQRWIEAIPELREREGWVELNILIVDTAAGQRFNRDFRGRDYATNVLSFPYEPGPGEHTGVLGDIVICAPVVAREALDQGKPVRDHFAHMTIHGVLHLLGYDHETDRDAERMEALERAILATLGVSDPYSLHD